MHGVEERLARWLLQSQDRVNSGHLPFTHEVLSHMLGARRSTVTLTATTLQRAGLIKYRRGKIDVTNRKGLQDVACTCYATMSRQFAAMLGPPKTLILS